MVCIALLTVVSSCSDDKDPVTYYDVAVSDVLPSSLPETYTVASGSLTFKELNTGEVIAKTLPLTDGLSVPAGTYNVEGRMTVRYDNGGVPAERSLRAVASQMVVSADKTVDLEWFFFNSENTLIFGEIFLSGTLNATGKTGLYDSYFTIYNNTDQVQYADGLAICESKIVNSVNYEIESPGILLTTTLPPRRYMLFLVEERMFPLIPVNISRLSTRLSTGMPRFPVPWIIRMPILSGMMK